MFKYMDDIKVTISCTTYNHEDYISDALEGFLMQKTNFSYEIFVHDDASTDRTAEIIKEKKKRNPDKIKGIYQKENQYSRGVAIIFDILLPMAHGKYIALCEGDDYWNDPYKLQKQMEEMERHPECELCAHGAMVVEAKTKQVVDEVKRSSENCIFPPEKVIAGGGGFVATNSLMIKREQLERDIDLLREFPLDYFVQIMGSIRGGMLYLSDIMSSYRWMAKNSWSERMNKDLERCVEHIDRCNTMLERIDTRTNRKYKDIIAKVIVSNKIYQLELNGQYKCIVKNYAQVLRKMPCRQRLKIYIKAYFPWLKTIRDRIRNGHDKQQ